MAGRFYEAFEAQTGKAVDKWEQYLAVYEREIGPMARAGRPLRLLEIGVQNGGSLEVWHRYLPPGSTVIGIDINPAVAALEFGDASIKAFAANALDDDAVDKCAGTEPFDIIIDDGSHICSEVIDAFLRHWKRVAGGGCYVIEDLHTSYYPSHGGGFGQPGSSIEFLKSLMDMVHADHLQIPDIDVANAPLWREIGPWIGRVSLYDSIAVIEKLPYAKRAPFRRLLNGEIAGVAPYSVWPPQSPASALRDLMLGESSLRRVEPQLQQAIIERDATIAVLTGQRDDALEKLRLLSQAGVALPSLDESDAHEAATT